MFTSGSSDDMPGEMFSLDDSHYFDDPLRMAKTRDLNTDWPAYPGTPIKSETGMLSDGGYEASVSPTSAGDLSMELYASCDLSKALMSFTTQAPPDMTSHHPEAVFQDDCHQLHDLGSVGPAGSGLSGVRPSAEDSFIGQLAAEPDLTQLGLTESDIATLSAITQSAGDALHGGTYHTDALRTENAGSPACGSLNSDTCGGPLLQEAVMAEYGDQPVPSETAWYSMGDQGSDTLRQPVPTRKNGKLKVKRLQHKDTGSLRFCTDEQHSNFSNDLAIKEEPLSPGGSLDEDEGEDEVSDQGCGGAPIDRKERRREQNRRAARKLREKKKKHFDRIEADYEDVVSSNRKLNVEIKGLRELLQSLQSKLSSHTCACRVGAPPHGVGSQAVPSPSWSEGSPSASPHLSDYFPFPATPAASPCLPSTPSAVHSAASTLSRQQQQQQQTPPSGHNVARCHCSSQLGSMHCETLRDR